MSKGGIKRKAEIELTSEGPDGLFVNEKSTKRNKSKSKNKRLSRLEEYNEDEGREGSRNFQRWAEIFENNTKGEGMKSKTFMKNFGAKVKKQTDRIRDYMEEQEKKLTQSKDQSVAVFEKLYLAAISPPGTPSEPDNMTHGTSKDGHILYKDAQTIVSESYALLRQFKEADERLKNHKLELPSAKWKQDGRDMKDLLACGREYGEKLVESKLVPKAYISHQPDRYNANEKESIASELFKDSCKGLDEDNWGTVAADQVKRLTAITKTIPSQGSERTKY
ncbi:hypothetical protein F4677DRAFT_403377 [Hypoxylon crocopeplum]|nr:hypothetical protein F4677DRAFT_403377 [Hypoxylon crocopeplum]